MRPNQDEEGILAQGSVGEEMPNKTGDQSTKRSPEQRLEEPGLGRDASAPLLPSQDAISGKQ